MSLEPGAVDASRLRIDQPSAEPTFTTMRRACCKGEWVSDSRVLMRRKLHAISHPFEGIRSRSAAATMTPSDPRSDALVAPADLQPLNLPPPKI